MMRELDESLARLKTDYLDYYFIHYPDGIHELSEVLKTMEELKTQKIVRYLGVSNINYELLTKIPKELIDVVQNKFSILTPEDRENIIPYCQENGIGYFAYSPLAQGLLTNSINADFAISKRDVRRFNPLFHRDTFSRLVADKTENDLYDAIDFVYQHSAVSSMLITATKPQHVRINSEIIDSFS